MNILGLNFGHDAAATVITKGRVRSYVLRERRTRVKHVVGLDIATIDLALAEAGLSAKEIDCVAFTSSQAVELVIDDPKTFSVRQELHEKHTNPGEFHALVASRRLDLAKCHQAQLATWVYGLPEDSWVGVMWRELFPDYRKYNSSSLPVVYPYLRRYADLKDWTKGKPLMQLSREGYYQEILSDKPFPIRQGFHYPLTVRFRGVAIPGYMIDHHYCHAASVYYQSGTTRAAVLTHDGAGDPSGFTTGGFYYGSGSKLYPLTPHYLVIGDLYHHVGNLLGLGRMGAPGKLMGLAPYGRPRFFENGLAGNYYDFAAAAQNKHAVKGWMQHCQDLARAMGYDLGPLGNPDKVLEPINVDIAASTQKLFEESVLRAVEALWRIVSGAGQKVDTLCLSGGTALNCPTNSRVFREGPFKNVFVEPACDDGGLAIGAAMFTYHNILGNDLVLDGRDEGGFEAYLGSSASAPADAGARSSLAETLRARHPGLDVTLPGDPAADAAGLLAEDKVVGWFEGRSEIGPRALGHRSILADPRQAENWPRVNRIKGREHWRPFAPMVLEEDLETWFRGVPTRSRHMLFNATVRSTSIPAVTHVDGTARVQTVSGNDGAFSRVLKEFAARTGVPVLLNTSFNGPGEPIVETAEDAVNFFLSAPLDALFIEGIRLTKR